MTSLNQQNFDRAVDRARDTLITLSGGALTLKQQHMRKLQQIAWDLEAIQTAIRSEINDRMGGAGGGMDLG